MQQRGLYFDNISYSLRTIIIPANPLPIGLTNNNVLTLIGKLQSIYCFITFKFPHYRTACRWKNYEFVYWLQTCAIIRCPFFTAVTKVRSGTSVGLMNSVYSVGEGAGFVEVCVAMERPGIPNLTVMLRTISGMIITSWLSAFCVVLAAH